MILICFYLIYSMNDKIVIKNIVDKLLKINEVYIIGIFFIYIKY